MVLVVTRTLALLAISTMIGAAHLWAQPVRTTLKSPAPTNDAPEQTDDTPIDPGTETQPQENDDPTTAVDPTPFDPNTLGQEITIEEAFKLFELGSTFVDARPLEEYLESHIPMAFALSPEAIETAQLDTFMSYNAPEQRVVIYCEGGDCHASESVGIYLQDLGYNTIHILTAGFPAWQEAGYEVETGNPFAEELP